ncbi:MAG: hypothetical protein KF886_21835 [Candidatus Hydrogenedentes bacterium]|nr:hypothetical protein [Candidatus Hydrogenedentota bacterium]
MHVRLIQTLLLLSGGLLPAAGQSFTLDAEHQLEFDAIAAQMREYREHTAAQARLQAESLHQAALIALDDGHPVDVVLRRTRALLDDLKAAPSAPDLEAEQQALAALRDKRIASRVLPDADETAMRLFAEACALRRRIAFKNPLLDFDRIIFLTHQRARYEHMVDQYYGFHAEPVGGIYVLEKPFSGAPTVRQLLRDVPIANGRLAGRTLDNGSFISLDLDFEGEQILFAWSEAQVPVPPEDLTPHEDLFTPESTYHIFKADIAETALTQLTDGAYNDFDPCWLPNGRIAFISERRGGYLRCGLRPNPTFTLHGMRADGSDIITLSYHETHEWHPSVNNDGMIVYTRWDYVDRDSDIAHHLWLTYPDGRDPRTSHANYPEFRESRPWMELSIRAIPDSRKYVAVAAPHHGQSYGSLVLIDLAEPDDRAMSQIKRITPDTAFPESEEYPGVQCPPHAGRNRQRAERYGAPWPLSENYYLAVYDPGQKHYGLYLVDAFGNRELLYRDPEVACLDPIPLRPRTKPPIIPSLTRQAEEDRVGPMPSTGHLAIMNIYDSAHAWPDDTKITGMRIIQMFPKTTPAASDPQVGIGDQSLVRGVLGTVPVEADGSVFCEAPAGIPFYFQALDEKGRAVQTMRSVTYLHPGEMLSCAGCHEDKQRTVPFTGNGAPLAMRRPPSKPTPEVDGAYPVSFPRLVQPVLNKHCVDCHAKDDAAPSLAADAFGKWGWTDAYHTLAPFAWAKHGGNGALKKNVTSYSIPGQVGAMGSTLLPYLEESHYGVKLTDAERYRITLWLDCNSVFYGAYHDAEMQARGDLIRPWLE